MNVFVARRIEGPVVGVEGRSESISDLLGGPLDHRHIDRLRCRLPGSPNRGGIAGYRGLPNEPIEVGIDHERHRVTPRPVLGLEIGDDEFLVTQVVGRGPASTKLVPADRLRPLRVGDSGAPQPHDAGAGHPCIRFVEQGG
jgi:hypothetical protein